MTKIIPPMERKNSNQHQINIKIIKLVHQNQVTNIILTGLIIIRKRTIITTKIQIRVDLTIINRLKSSNKMNNRQSIENRNNMSETNNNSMRERLVLGLLINNIQDNKEEKSSKCIGIKPRSKKK
jgi:hypothetical protein